MAHVFYDESLPVYLEEDGMLYLRHEFEDLLQIPIYQDAPPEPQATSSTEDLADGAESVDYAALESLLFGVQESNLPTEVQVGTEHQFFDIDLDQEIPLEIAYDVEVPMEHAVALEPVQRFSSDPFGSEELAPAPRPGQSSMFASSFIRSDANFGHIMEVDDDDIEMDCQVINLIDTEDKVEEECPSRSQVVDLSTRPVHELSEGTTPSKNVPQFSCEIEASAAAAPEPVQDISFEAPVPKVAVTPRKYTIFDPSKIFGKPRATFRKMMETETDDKDIEIVCEVINLEEDEDDEEDKEGQIQVPVSSIQSVQEVSRLEGSAPTKTSYKKEGENGLRKTSARRTSARLLARHIG